MAKRRDIDVLRRVFSIQMRVHVYLTHSTTVRNQRNSSDFAEIVQMDSILILDSVADSSSNVLKDFLFSLMSVRKVKFLMFTEEFARINRRLLAPTRPTHMTVKILKWDIIRIEAWNRHVELFFIAITVEKHY